MSASFRLCKTTLCAMPLNHLKHLAAAKVAAAAAGRKIKNH